MATMVQTRTAAVDQPAETLPLLAAQLGVWVADRAHGTSSDYVTADVTEIDGPIDPILFRAAANRVVAEIEALRIRIVEPADGPRLNLPPCAATPLEIIELASDADIEPEARDWAGKIRARGLDPATGPAFAWALLRGPARSAFVACTHHVALDWGGRRRVVARLAECYGCATPPPCGNTGLAPLVKADRAYRSSAAYDSDRNWALAQVAAAPDPRLPGTPARGLAGTRALQRLAPDEVAALRRRAAGWNATLPQLLCAAWAALLARITGQDDLLIGLQTSGRLGQPRADEAGAPPAMLTNMVPLRLAAPLTAPASEFLAQTARAMRAALRRQRYPHQALRAAMGLGPADPDPLAVSFNHLPPGPALRFAGAAARMRNLSHGPVHELGLSAEEHADGSLELQLDANRQRHTPEAVATLAGRLTLLLAGFAAAHADCPIGSLAVMDATERRRVTEDFPAGPAAPAFAHPADLIAAQAGRTPSAIAVICGSDRLDFAALDAASNRLARLLAARGTGPGQRVAIALPRIPALVVAVLGVLKAGAAFVPLDPAAPPARRARMLALAQVDLVLVATEADAALAAGRPVLALATAALAPLSPAPLSDRDRTGARTADDLAYVIFTSGSTGAPKGVEVTQAALSAYAQGMVAAIPMRTGEAAICVTTIGFDAAIFDLFVPLVQGGTIVLLDETAMHDPAAIRDAVWRHDPSVLSTTPGLLRLLLAEGTLPPGLCPVIGGESFPADLAPRVATLRAPRNAYGPTETTDCATIHRIAPEDGRHGPVPVGRPLPGYRVDILDEAGGAVPVGVAGELHIGGAAVARGYCGDSALTAERFVASPRGGRMYRTGDMGRWRADGTIELLGRRDDQINAGGYRIEPGEIAVALRRLPGVADAAVLAWPQGLTAYVVPACGSGAPRPAALRTALAADLPHWMIPAAFIALPALPLSANGKLDRRALPAPQSQPAAYRPPVTGIEGLLCREIARVAGLRQVGLDDDLFDLGLCSLDLLTLVARLRTLSGRELRLATLFEHRAPAQIAAAWERDAPPMPAAGTPRLFLLPGAGGEEPAVERLRQACRPQLDVSVLDYPGWRRLAGQGYDMAALIDALASDVIAQAPDGPVSLAGYSVGGLIAHAVAAALAARGRTVALLAILDTRADPAWFAAQARRGSALQLLYWDLLQFRRAVPEGRAARHAAYCLAERLATPAGRAVLRCLGRVKLRTASRTALRIRLEEVMRLRLALTQPCGCDAAPPPAETVVFRTDRHRAVPADLGWSARFANCRVVPVAGDHRSMLEAPALGRLAAELVRSAVAAHAECTAEALEPPPR